MECSGLPRFGGNKRIKDGKWSWNANTWDKMKDIDSN